MKRIICALAMLASACGGAAAPTSPSHAGAQTPRAFGSFDTTSQLTASGAAADFARCLRGADGAGCFSAARIRTKASTAAAAIGTPSNLSATSIGSAVTLTWAAPASTDAVVAYIVEAGSSPGQTNLADFSTGSAATSLLALGVGAGTYFVRVRAISATEISAPSNEAVLVVTGTDCTSPPAPPRNLSVALNSGGTVMLTWTAAAGTPTSYVVEAGTAPGLTNAANSDLGLTTTLTATGVSPGIYYVRIRARNACGTGLASNELAIAVSINAAAYTGTWRGQFQVVECTDLTPPGVTPVVLCGLLQRLNTYDLTLSQTGSVVTGTYRPVTYLMSCPCAGDYGIFEMAGTVAPSGVLTLSGTAGIRGWGVAAPMTFSLFSGTPGTLTGSLSGNLAFGGLTRAAFSGIILTGNRQ